MADDGAWVLEDFPFGDDVSIVQCSCAQEDIWMYVALSSGYKELPLTSPYPK